MTSLLPVFRRRTPSFSDDGFIARFFNDFDYPTSFNGNKTFVPALDISESENEYLVKAELPGVEKENVDITLTNGLLTIKGEKKQENETKEEDYCCVERSYGSFCRTLRVPIETESDKVDANYKDGVLTVSIPKSPKAETKKIAVKSD